MSIQILPVDHARDWSEVARLLLDTEQDASASFLYYHFPRPDPKSECDGAEEWERNIAQFLKNQCMADASLYPVKAIQETTGKMLGCALRRIQSQGTKTRDGVDKGSMHSLTTAPKVQGPHVFLSFLTTHPASVPISNLLMKWGIDRADSLGLVVWTCSAFTDGLAFKRHDLRAVDVVFETIRKKEVDGGIWEYTEKYWRVRRERVDNRQVWKEMYLDTQGFW